MKDFAEKTLWLIPLLPLMGFAINGLAGRRLTQSMPGKWAVAAIACLLPAASFALSVTAVLALRQTGQDVLQAGMTWIQAGAVNVAFGLRVDWLTAVMILVVTGVGTLIHIYSIGYMWDDEAFGRFFAYLNLFMCAMLVLVLADNLLLMFVGWEGVGLCSYLLIGFWYHDLKNADAGKKAFIVNRIGDFGFILG
ncbi:MAG: NADH-quinone oxidoreductase subunit L, partial [Planctomycetes bacterium]|nr:NADH-quinone oxidoreductase subunit L [Planctomycetota bacterium]